MSMNLKGKRRRRGSVLLLSIFFLIVLFSLAVTFFRIIPAEFHSATQSRRGIQAQYAADAGVREAVAWLKIQPAVDDTNLAAFSSAHSSPAAVGQQVDQDWSYTVGMTTADPIRKIYDVVSVAYFRGNPVSEIRTTVRNETFAKYALFYDTWGDDFLYTMAPDAIQGPFHTNQFFHLSVPADANGFWNTVGKDPFVNGDLAEMTFAQTFTDGSNPMVGKGDGQMYYGGNYNGNDAAKRPYADDGVPDANRYAKVIKGGREKISQIAKVDFPEAVTELRSKAWDATGPQPTAAQITTMVNANGPLLVNTDAGANAPGGNLKGGVLYAQNAKDVSLDITLGNGNHQKITITDEKNTKVPGAGATSYSWKEQQYRAMVPQPDQAVTTGGGCKKSHTEPATRDVWVSYVVQVMKQHPSCGQETVFIPGSGGVSTPIKVDKTCLVDETRWKTVKENYTRTVCDEYYPTVTTMVPQPDREEVVDAAYPGAYPKGTTNHSGSTPPPTGTYVGTVTTTVGDLTIPTVSSVIEVNDADYKIPYFSGMKVDGEVITDPNDSRLTVTDGHTVTVKNDVIKNGTNFAEYTVMKGRVNGVIFSDGNLKGVHGTAKGSKHTDELGNLAYRGRTIATDIQKNKDMEISGNILQYYDGNVIDGKGNPLKNSQNQLVPGNHSPNADHILGMVARNVSIKQATNVKSKHFDMSSDRDANGKIQSYLKGLTVYGVVMAGRKVSSTKVDGGFGADASAMKSDDDLGDFNLFGGIISGNARSTQTPNGGSTDGFRLNLNYDEIAAMNLENFPRTNLYSVVRYVTVRRGSTGTGFGSMSGL